MNLEPNITNITGAYGTDHAKAVSMSRININVSTSGGASDRIFKVLAAGGFLLTSDWVGRDKLFEDGKHLVVFKDKNDLQEKISYYLSNENKRDEIAKNGNAQVQKYNRDEWAKQIVKIFQEELGDEAKG